MTLTDTTPDPAAGIAPSPLTRAMETVRHLRAQLDKQRAAKPVAVVGAGLRFPGRADDFDSYWEVLAAGRDLVRSMPDERMEPFGAEWERLPRRGGFLDEVLDFDAAFFGIKPDDAGRLDPQHRLLLEVAWEALENAGLPPGRLGDACTGVYVGLTTQDYRDWCRGDPDIGWATGNGGCFATGRMAYTMNLTGPAVAVDTACSSSLVSVHLAVQALRHGECDIALAGGVNLILSPRTTALVQQSRSLAPDGLCRAFDARGRGFSRGEGCGIVVLKRLDQAVRDGDRVHAVIRGSAVNTQGRPPGFTIPSVRSQVSLIRAALADADLAPADIGLIEAHGTGTPFGDVVEVEALIAALDRRAAGGALHIGSVKTNFGHLEAAAGIAALIKAILCLRHRVVPPLVHFETLNPRIRLDGTGIVLPGNPVRWPPGSGGYAGISSFGMSGTNAHIILGLAEETAAQVGNGTSAAGFEVTARTTTALRALAQRFGDHLAKLPPEDYAAFAYTVTSGRERHQIRARVAAADKAAAVAALDALAHGASSPAVTLTAVGSSLDDLPLPALPRRVIDLPGYPWERQRYAPAGVI